MRTSLASLLSIVLIGGIAWYFFDQSLPCKRPIVLSIGAVDPAFRIGTTEFTQQVEASAKLWSDAVRKTLFTLKPRGGILVRAVYDQRQQTVDQLGKLGIKLDFSEGSYLKLRAQYDFAKSAFDDAGEAYARKTAAFEVRKAAYEAKVDAAERSGGVRQEELRVLEAERTSINALLPGIEQDYAALERQRDSLNALGTILNRAAAEHNNSVTAYRTLGEGLGSQYEAGLYERLGGHERITVYAFRDPVELKNLLTHELGHALGLPHLEDPNAIMYKLNESENRELSTSDVIALKERCGL